ncbi:phosphotyrosine protein phosphatase I superfamily [Rhodotorula toruloides]
MPALRSRGPSSAYAARPIALQAGSRCPVSRRRTGASTLGSKGGRAQLESIRPDVSHRSIDSLSSDIEASRGRGSWPTRLSPVRLRCHRSLSLECLLCCLSALGESQAGPHTQRGRWRSVQARVRDSLILISRGQRDGSIALGGSCDRSRGWLTFLCIRRNICRSPLAEAVFADMVKKRGFGDDFTVDSAGTAGFHVGEEPDERSVEVCRRHGVPVNSVCRQFEKADFTRFDYIIGMDSMNMSNIEKAKPANSTAKIALFGSFGDGKVIQDPYYGGKDGFEKTYKQCVRYSEGLLKAMGYDDASGGKL